MFFSLLVLKLKIRIYINAHTFTIYVRQYYLLTFQKHHFVKLRPIFNLCEVAPKVSFDYQLNVTIFMADGVLRKRLRMIQIMIMIKCIYINYGI